MFVLWHQSTALMPMQFAPPTPSLRPMLVHYNLLKKKIRNVPWWVKKQGVQIPCGTYGAYPKTTSQFAVAIATENYWGCPGVVWRGVNLC